jgi:hypothetical protein
VQRVTIDATADVATACASAPTRCATAAAASRARWRSSSNGVSYVPVTPIVAALGGESDWHAPPA